MLFSYIDFWFSFAASRQLFRKPKGYLIALKICDDDVQDLTTESNAIDPIRNQQDLFIRYEQHILDSPNTPNSQDSDNSEPVLSLEMVKDIVLKNTFVSNEYWKKAIKTSQH